MLPANNRVSVSKAATYQLFPHLSLQFGLTARPHLYWAQLQDYETSCALPFPKYH